MQVKLISLLTSCGLKVDDSSLGEIIETHLNQAAHTRYRSLKASIGKPRGLALATLSCYQASSAAHLGLVWACEHAAQAQLCLRQQADGSLAWCFQSDAAHRGWLACAVMMPSPSAL